MNNPKSSKINWTSGATALVTILFLALELPKEYLPHVLVLVGIVVPLIVIVFRTWWTAK